MKKKELKFNKSTVAKLDKHELEVKAGAGHTDKVFCKPSWPPAVSCFDPDCYSIIVCDTEIHC
ncbi:MAG: hypothetical protein ACEPOV_08470 [Hyphomicrobiales bacterium]